VTADYFTRGFVT